MSKRNGNLHETLGGWRDSANACTPGELCFLHRCDLRTAQGYHHDKLQRLRDVGGAERWEPLAVCWQAVSYEAQAALCLHRLGIIIVHDNECVNAIVQWA